MTRPTSAHLEESCSKVNVRLFAFISRMLACFRGLKSEGLPDRFADFRETMCPLSIFSFTLAHIFQGHPSPLPNSAPSLGSTPAESLSLPGERAHARTEEQVQADLSRTNRSFSRTPWTEGSPCGRCAHPKSYMRIGTSVLTRRIMGSSTT